MMNVITTMRSTLMPIRLAISLSSATARIDRPVRLRCTNSCSATIAHDRRDEHESWTFAIAMPPISTVARRAPAAAGSRRLGAEEPPERVLR